MAAVDEESKVRRSRTHRRRKRDTSDRQPCDDEVATPASHIFDRPANAQELRDARLKSLQTPASERRKMKIEYTYERPARQKTSTDKPRRASSIFGFGGSTSSPKGSSKTKRSQSVRATALRDQEEDQFVYGAPHWNTNSRRESDNQVIEEDADANRSKTKPKTERKENTAKTPERRRIDRRRTEPALKKTSSVINTSTRPPLRKSTTALPATASATPRASATRAETEVGPVKPSNPARKSSVFGGIFSAPPPQPERKVACLTCGSDDIPISRAAKLPCGHRMCHACLKRIFKMSITDPAHMPPRCCTEKHIDLKHVDSLFDHEFKKIWNRKFKEYNAKNRIYCPRKGCGEWVQPKHMTVEQGRKLGRCPKCKTYVCGICNQKAHKSRECPKDPTTKQFVEVAKEKGWQRCYNCSAMVELKEGCNHMTCRCTAEFCMVCGLKWKSCDCPWFNYEAVDDHLGNPVRYQQELDRRREQERRDEEFARHLQRLGVNNDGNNGDRAVYGIGNAAGHHLNQNFVQQAREALTANYQNAEQAARVLLNGIFMGRENPLPGFPGNLDDTTRDLRQPGAAQVPGSPPARRRPSTRRQTPWQAPPATRDETLNDHDRRIRDWANRVDTGI